MAKIGILQSNSMAWVENNLPEKEDLITHWLRRDEHKNFTKAFTSEVKNADKAQLKYQVLKKDGKLSLLRIELLTGRKHQIRAQLSAIGCPIVGDLKYGASAANRDGSIALQSSELHFKHPVGGEALSIVLNHS